MTIQTMDTLLRGHAFFQGMPENLMSNIVGCGRNQVFKKSQFLAKEGKPADEFYVIRTGRVAIELRAGGHCLRVQTAGPGEVVGWSWLFPPHEWTFDVQALEETHTIALNGKCLRGKCEKDPVLGYHLMKRFAGILIQRLSATRLQLLDVYGSKESGAFGR